MDETFPENDPDAVERALKAHLAEYESLRDEIIARYGIQNQLANFAIPIALGAASLFAIGDPNLASQQPFLLLIASMLISGICWSMVGANMHANDIQKYIRFTLSPKIRNLIATHASPDLQVIQWEGARLHRSGRLVVKGLVSLGRYAAAYIPSVVFIILFYSMQPPIAKWTLAEAILFWAAIIMALTPIVAGLANSLFVTEVGSKPLGGRGRRNPAKEDSRPSRRAERRC